MEFEWFQLTAFQGDDVIKNYIVINSVIDLQAFVRLLWSN